MIYDQCSSLTLKLFGLAKVCNIIENIITSLHYKIVSHIVVVNELLLFIFICTNVRNTKQIDEYLFSNKWISHVHTNADKY